MKTTFKPRGWILLLSLLGISFMLLACKSEHSRQMETETVKESTSIPFTKALYLDLLAKEEKNEPYSQLVYTFSGEVVGVKSEQTKSSTTLNLDLLLFLDPEIEATCEFDDRSLDFISGIRIGNHLKLRAKISSVTNGRARFVGTIPEPSSTQTHP